MVLSVQRYFYFRFGCRHESILTNFNENYQPLADEEKIRFYRSIFYPALFVILLWLIKGVDIIFDLGLNNYGLFPLEAKGLIGILTCPLLHANLAHLFANSVPLLILGTFLFYFYKDIAWKTLGLLYLTTGIWVWVFARRLSLWRTYLGDFPATFSKPAHLLGIPSDGTSGRAGIGCLLPETGSAAKTLGLGRRGGG